MSTSRQQIIQAAEQAGRAEAVKITDLATKASTTELQMRVRNWLHKLETAKKAQELSAFDIQGFSFSHQLAVQALAFRLNNGG